MNDKAPLLPASVPLVPAATAPADTKKKKAEKPVYTAADRILLAFALLLGVLFDRLFLVYYSYQWVRPTRAAFWLAFLAVFYALNWKRLKNDKLLWTVAGFSAALCAWNFVFWGNNTYGQLTGLVIPGVLMAHAVVTHAKYTLKQVASIVRDWLGGWFILPFSAIPTCFGSAASLVTGDGKQTAFLKVLCAVGISIPLLLVIVPLLGSADLVFGHYVDNLLYNLDFQMILFHGILILALSVLFYSFLWNTRSGKVSKAVPEIKVELDTLICSVVLGILLGVYLLFCTVQFTYLFARAGLPLNMTYSEYARQGFWQLILIAGINLLIFGVLLQYGRKHRALSAMLGGLLALTFVMLVSGMVRLGLYISIYGMTWLRLLSAWFVLYLGAVLVLCAVRMVRANLPLIGICAVVLLGWYTTLGYINPDSFIERYNNNAAGIQMNVAGDSQSAWLTS